MPGFSFLQWFLIHSVKIGSVQWLLIGEANTLVEGYGWTRSLYAPALASLEEHFGSLNSLFNAFLETPTHRRYFNLTIPDSYTQMFNFLFTLVGTFHQLQYNHDMHSTTKVNQNLNMLPTPVSLEWNKHSSEGIASTVAKKFSIWIFFS